MSVEERQYFPEAQTEHRTQPKTTNSSQMEILIGNKAHDIKSSPRMQLIKKTLHP